MSNISEKFTLFNYCIPPAFVSFKGTITITEETFAFTCGPTFTPGKDISPINLPINRFHELFTSNTIENYYRFAKTAKGFLAKLFLENVKTFWSKFSTIQLEDDELVILGFALCILFVHVVQQPTCTFDQAVKHIESCSYLPPNCFGMLVSNQIHHTCKQFLTRAGLLAKPAKPNRFNKPNKPNQPNKLNKPKKFNKFNKPNKPVEIAIEPAETAETPVETAVEPVKPNKRKPLNTHKKVRTCRLCNGPYEKGHDCQVKNPREPAESEAPP